MNTKHKKQNRHPKITLSSESSPVIRIITSKERTRFDKLLGEYHYLGESHPAGDTMRMVATIDGKWIALLMWGSAAYCLKDRDAYINWTPSQRAQRQKLIVQNRRYLLLSKRGEYPNLASQILGAAVKALPELWDIEFGYKPLLAETFTDIEAFEGTCYKAAGWTPLGKTKGYSRDRADFYVPNERPKKLWVKKLHKDALNILQSHQLPQEYINGANSCDDGIMPINAKNTRSLNECLRTMPDPRAGNTTFHIGSILTIVAMAILSGHRNISSIVRFTERMTLAQRKKIRLPVFEKGSTYYKVPSYKVYWNLLSKLDIDLFSKRLSDWLSENSGILPRALAVDGKFIKDTVGIVCMADHETGVPYAMIKASKKEGEGDECEMKATQQIIKQQKDLTNTVITADALHCQRATAREIVSRGGEYILQVKGNQKTVEKMSELKTKDISPFLLKSKKDTEE